MAARIVSDETKEAGNFMPVGNVQARCDDGTRYGSPGPCSGTREFAEPVMAPATGPGDGYTFDVTWSPPANEAGNLDFYVADVAANGDGTPAGDWAIPGNQPLTVITSIVFNSVASGQMPAALRQESREQRSRHAHEGDLPQRADSHG